MPKAVTAKKKSAKSAKPATARVRKLTRKQARAKAKKEARTRQPIIGSIKLTAQVAGIFRQHWKQLGGIVLIYLILNVLFASGISSLSSNVASIKASLANQGVHAHPLVTGLSGFMVLVGSSGAISSATGSALQSMLIILESLVIIWALRHLLAGQTFRVKQAYYNAMTPLVPFLLIVFFIVLQLLPVMLGSLALAAITSSLGAVSGVWTAVFAVLFVLLAAWSIYMVSASIFALYIVTLPGMYPRDALRSAKKLVQFRRWSVLWRVLFMPVVILVVMGLVIIPLILYATWLVVPVFYILGMISILFVHTYLYSLYRSLLA